MQRLLATAATTAAVVMLTAGPALAQSVTVPGKAGGDVSKMTANNAASTVTVTIFGLPGPCDTRNVDASVSWGSGSAHYLARSACYAGTDWVSTLSYVNASGADTDVPCPSFTMRYLPAQRAYRAVLPRTCLPKAPDRIKAYGEAVVYGGSAIVGMAGPTKLLARG